MESDGDSREHPSAPARSRERDFLRELAEASGQPPQPGAKTAPIDGPEPPPRPEPDPAREGTR